MRHAFIYLCLLLGATGAIAASTSAQKALTRQEVRAKFEAANPTL